MIFKKCRDLSSVKGLNIVHIYGEKYKTSLYLLPVVQVIFTFNATKKLPPQRNPMVSSIHSATFQLIYQKHLDVRIKESCGKDRDNRKNAYWSLIYSHSKKLHLFLFPFPYSTSVCLW
jgi:hypothetical protein